MIGATRPRFRAVFRGIAPVVSLAILAAFVVIALGAPVLAPYDPRAQPDVVNAANLPPSFVHPFGTDPFSRDVLSRVMHGATTSLAVALFSVVIALAIGATVGAVAGYAGGRTDRWITRSVDAILSTPRVLLLLLIAAAFGQLSLTGLVLVIGLTGWPAMTRIIRAQVREIAALDYVLAARALGVRPSRILVRHVMPAVLPQMFVAATLAVASVIPLEAGLAFLGLGVRDPTPSWGNIMLDGYRQGFTTWWTLFFPIAAIVLTVLAVNVISERVREAIDPRVPPPA